MRIFIIFLLLLSNSLEAQKNDLLILDGVKYKGKLLNYSKSDIRSPDSGKISFFIYRLDDTLNISSDRNLKLKINRYSEFYEFTKRSWNNIEYGINTGNFSTNTGAFISKGFFNISVFCWWIISFAVVSAALLPALVPPASQRYTSAVKNGLVNGIKECVVLNSDNQTTRFADVQSFQGNYTQFKIESLDPNSCYKAKAVPTSNQNTWFQIDLNMETGKVSKTCGDSSKPGCSNGNTW